MTSKDFSLLLAAAALSLALGCGQSAPPESLPVEQVPSTVENAFKEADSDLKASASEVVSSLQAKDESKAFVDLQTLFSRPDLSPEQREAANRSMIALNAKLRAAAAKGDQRAADALQLYRATK